MTSLCVITFQKSCINLKGTQDATLKYSAVQTPVLSPPAPAPAKKTPAPGKKTPAPAENFRLVQICQNWKFLQFKLETPSL